MNKERKNPHYVNNKEFHEALIEYKRRVNIAKEKGMPPPRITNYLGDCFLKIATHLSYRPNFVNYMFREDMISDGVENCVNYINNFDINRNNPFAYFTQIVYYAFLRRIHKEKKQMEIKEKIIERSGYDEVFTVDSDDYNYSDYNTIKDNIQIKLNQ
ncbi:MAG: sigma factor for late transcription [Candidatus Fonsibacter ubiquis]